MTDATVGRPIPGPNGMDARLDPARASKDEIGYWGGRNPKRISYQWPIIGVIVGIVVGLSVAVSLAVLYRLPAVAPAKVSREAVHQPLPQEAPQGSPRVICAGCKRTWSIDTESTFREFEAYRRGMEAASDALFRQHQSR